jgi:hypothetical protein
MINSSSNSNNGISSGGNPGGGGFVTTGQNLSKVSLLPNSSPTVRISGLYELSLGGDGSSNVIVHQQSPHNSSGSSSPPKLSPVYPAAIDPSQAQQDSGLI